MEREICTCGIWKSHPGSEIVYLCKIGANRELDPVSTLRQTPVIYLSIHAYMHAYKEQEHHTEMSLIVQLYTNTCIYNTCICHHITICLLDLYMNISTFVLICVLPIVGVDPRRSAQQSPGSRGEGFCFDHRDAVEHQRLPASTQRWFEIQRATGT